MTDAVVRLEALFILSITLGLRSGELRKLTWMSWFGTGSPDPLTREVSACQSEPPSQPYPACPASLMCPVRRRTRGHQAGGALTFRQPTYADPSACTSSSALQLAQIQQRRPGRPHATSAGTWSDGDLQAGHAGRVGGVHQPMQIGGIMISDEEDWRERVSSRLNSGSRSPAACPWQCEGERGRAVAGAA